MPIIVDMDLFDEVMVQVGGFGRIHIWLLLTCGMFNMYVFVETMGSSVVIPTSECDLRTNASEGGAARVLTMLGILTSSYFMAYLADRIGRKKILMCMTVPSLIFSYSAMLSPNLIVYMFMRFLTGICVGGLSAAHLVYLGEFCTNKHRAIVIHYMAMFTAFGMLFVPGIATLVFMMDFRYKITSTFVIRPWRLLGIIYSAPGLIGMLLLIGLPESPKFLLASDQHDKAMATMERVCRMNRKKSLLDFGIVDLRHVISYEEDPEESKGTCFNVFHDALPLFKKPLKSKFILSCLIQFFMVSTGNGLTLWFTEMRGRRIKNYVKGHGVCHEIQSMIRMHDLLEKENVKICNDRITKFDDSLFMSLSFIIGFNIMGLLLRCVPRRIIFITALCISCTFGLITVYAESENVIQIAFILFLSFTVIVINLLGGAVVDFAPTYLRGKALALCLMSGRLGAIISCNLLGVALEWFCFVVFQYFTFCPLIAATLATLLRF